MVDDIGDIESAGNTVPSTLRPLPPMSPPDQKMDESFSKDAGNEPSWWRQPLYEALLQGDWDAIKQILDIAQDSINGPVDEDKSTPLVLAVAEGLEMPIIKKLVARMSPEALDTPQRHGLTALHWAALKGNLPVAELLINKNSKLPNSDYLFSLFPVHLAAARGRRRMTFYLHKNVDEDKKRTIQFSKTLLRCAFGSGMHDLALHLLQQNWELVKPDMWPLGILVERSHGFPSGSELNMCQSIIYSCIPKPINLLENLEQEGVVKREGIVKRNGVVKQDILHSQGQSQKHLRVYQELEKVRLRVFQMLGTIRQIKNIRDLKLKHCQALELLNILCMEIKSFDKKNISDVLGPHFMSAIRMGIPEVVEKMLEVFPDLIEYRDVKNKGGKNEDGKNLGGKTPFQLAAEYRDEKIFHILLQPVKKKEEKRGPFERGDLIFYPPFYGNSFLHLVAQRPRRNRLGAGSGVVLQVQRELQWYKGVEKLMPPALIFEKNGDGKLPIEVFDEEHQDMVKSEGEWIISMSNSCIVGGSLIAAVVFAAAITVPGGNKDDGVPNFSKDKAFKVFAFSDAFALASSLITVVTFLSIFTTRHSVNDFLYGLPNRLIIGLMSLLFAMTFMMIAFSATVYLVFTEDHHWIFYPTAALSCISVIFFAYLQLSSVVNMIKSTYGHNILKQAEKMKSNNSEFMLSLKSSNSESMLFL